MEVEPKMSPGRAWKMTAADVTLLTLIWRTSPDCTDTQQPVSVAALGQQQVLPESAFSVPGPSVLGGKPIPLVLRVAGPLGLLGLPWTPELGSTVSVHLWVLLWVPELASPVGCPSLGDDCDPGLLYFWSQAIGMDFILFLYLKYRNQCNFKESQNPRDLGKFGMNHFMSSRGLMGVVLLKHPMIYY